MQKKHLRELANVGKDTLKDLEVLGIDTIELLAEQNPTFLFQELERRTQKQHDPCVWDVFAAIIHEAKTAIPTKWWEWTAKRKALGFPLHAEGNSD